MRVSLNHRGAGGAAHTKRAGTNFFAQPVLSANAEVESMRRGVGHWMLVSSRGMGVSQRSGEKWRKEDRERRGWIMGAMGG